MCRVSLIPMGVLVLLAGCLVVPGCRSAEKFSRLPGMGWMARNKDKDVAELARRDPLADLPLPSGTATSRNASGLGQTNTGSSRSTPGSSYAGATTSYDATDGSNWGSYPDTGYADPYEAVNAHGQDRGAGSPSDTGWPNRNTQPQPSSSGAGAVQQGFYGPEYPGTRQGGGLSPTSDSGARFSGTLAPGTASSSARDSRYLSNISQSAASAAATVGQSMAQSYESLAQQTHQHVERQAETMAATTSQLARETADATRQLGHQTVNQLQDASRQVTATAGQQLDQGYRQARAALQRSQGAVDRWADRAASTLNGSASAASVTYPQPADSSVPAGDLGDQNLSSRAANDSGYSSPWPPSGSGASPSNEYSDMPQSAYGPQATQSSSSTYTPAATDPVSGRSSGTSPWRPGSTADYPGY